MNVRNIDLPADVSAGVDRRLSKIFEVHVVIAHGYRMQKRVLCRGATNGMVFLETKEIYLFITTVVLYPEREFADL